MFKVQTNNIWNEVKSISYNDNPETRDNTRFSGIACAAKIISILINVAFDLCVTRNEELYRATLGGQGRI